MLSMTLSEPTTSTTPDDGQTLTPRLIAVLTVPWVLPGLIATFEVYLGSDPRHGLTLWQSLTWQMPLWLLWGGWALFLRRLTLVCTYERLGAVRWLAMHIVACTVVAAVDLAAVAALDRRHAGPPTPSFVAMYKGALVLHLDLAVVLYWTTLGTIYMVEFHRRYRERSIDAARLEARLAMAELETLRMQLNPHFLFNALNAATELMHTRPQAAAEMVQGISGLLRQALRVGADQSIPLWQELELADTYIGVARVRFDRELEIHSDVSPDALDVLVPSLILQPLLENVFQHGLAADVPRPFLRLVAMLDGDEIELRVTNSHVRQDSPSVSGFGIGLPNTKARMAGLYGSRSRVVVDAGEDRPEFTVTLRFPAFVRAAGAHRRLSNLERGA